MRDWIKSITTAQKWWICGSTLSICLLGIISGDSWINILIGTVGMLYVSVYALGTTRWSFVLGIAYVLLYTVICLKNRIMLDAMQNVILIPIYAYSFVYWGKNNIKPRNMNGKASITVVCSALVVWGLLYGLSKLVHGNYSVLDSFNTTMTLYAMFLGMYGISLNWVMWSANNIISALTFGLALMTPTGSLTVFAMKCIFMINGFIGWYNFRKIGNKNN